MHTIKILLTYYLNISVQAANLSVWRIESNRKKIDSVARIESNQIETFLPETDCSNVAYSLSGIFCDALLHRRRLYRRRAL